MIKVIESLYLTEKNERYGLVNEKDEVVLHTCYNSIEHIVDITDSNVFVVSSECGYFIFNQTANIQSKIYDEINSRKDGNFIVRENEKYGLISATGQLLIATNYEYNSWGNNLYGTFKGYRYTIYVQNNLLYGRFPIDSSVKYMLFSLGYHVGNKIIVTSQNNKYGILWDNERYVVEDTILDDIIVREQKGLNSIFEHISFGTKKAWYTTVFLIAKKDNKYRVYNAANQKCLISDCDDASYIHIYRMRQKGDHDCIKFVKRNEVGYITTAGIVLDNTKFDNIEIVGSRFHVSKNGKWGVLYYSGIEIIPCKFDKIHQLNDYEFNLTLDGEETKLKLEKPRSYINTYESKHYDRFGGAFGYSDEDIDTIFDGDPSAYWNID